MTVSTIRVRIEDLRLPPNVPAGMNPLRLLALAYAYRSSNEEVEGPVEVTRDGGGWRIHDGRHRALAALIAGRSDVLCVDVTPADPECDVLRAHVISAEHTSASPSAVRRLWYGMHSHGQETERHAHSAGTAHALQQDHNHVKTMTYDEWIR